MCWRWPTALFCPGRPFETPLCVFVRDTTGLLAGRVTDYAIDEATLQIEAIEVMPGYTPSERRKRLWMFDYVHRDERALELTIPACLGRELSEKREVRQIAGELGVEGI